MIIRYAIDPFPDRAGMAHLWVSAWGPGETPDFAAILKRGLGHIGAYDGERLIGFVNIATDGGFHAFILDTCVDPDVQRRGIAAELVRRAIDLARTRGAHWLHVDFEEHLEGFYRACGFRPTKAGLIDLRESR